MKGRLSIRNAEIRGNKEILHGIIASQQSDSNKSWGHNVQHREYSQ